LSELNNHIIHPEWHLSSDHTPLSVTILISEEFVNMCKKSIRKDRDEEEIFVKDIISVIKKLDISNISEISILEEAVNNFAKGMDNVWNKNTKFVNITKHSKSWWNDNCSRDLNRYRLLKRLEDWKFFHKTIKNTKKTFFNLKITEIANKK